MLTRDSLNQCLRGQLLPVGFWQRRLWRETAGPRTETGRWLPGQLLQRSASSLGSGTWSWQGLFGSTSPAASCCPSASASQPSVQSRTAVPAPRDPSSKHLKHLCFLIPTLPLCSQTQRGGPFPVVAALWYTYGISFSHFSVLVNNCFT